MLVILADRLSFKRHTYLSMIRFFRQIRYSKTKDTFSRHFYDLTLRHGIEARHMFVFLYARILHLDLLLNMRDIRVGIRRA